MAEIDLSSLAFFEGFDAASLARVAALGEPVVAEQGAVICEQGSVGQEAFVVTSGEVQIIVSGHPVASAGPGSLLGEMALVDLRPRSATLIAATPVELVSYNAKAFRKILDALSAEQMAHLIENNERFRAENDEVSGDGRPRRITG